jgi:hypothetical protein
MRTAPGRPGFQASVRAQGHAPGPFGLNIVSMPDGAVLDGVLERVTFANPENGYTIARIAPERGQRDLRGGVELVTAVGPLLGAAEGVVRETVPAAGGPVAAG